MHRIIRLSSIHRIVIGIAATALSMTAYSQSFTGKQMSLVIPYPPGTTSSNVFGRVIAEHMSKALGQRVIVENKPGAGGNVGAEGVARSAPDGATMLLGSNGTITIGPSLYSNLNYDPLSDLAPVTMFANVPYMLVVPASLPVRSVQEFIALAKSQPGMLHYISSGNGTTPHLCGEWLKKKTGIDIVHVPYKGGALAMTDLLAGRVAMYCAGGPSVIDYIRGGKLRSIGLTVGKRSPLLPDVPTMGEQGVYEMDNVTSWIAIFVAGKTPSTIIQKLHQVIAQIMQGAEIRKLVMDQAGEPMAMGPAEFSGFIKAEAARWAEIVKATGARID